MFPVLGERAQPRHPRIWREECQKEAGLPHPEEKVEDSRGSGT